MKKILVVLLVLAVAGGVFAQQGEWGVSGKAVIGTHIDLDPTDGDPTFTTQTGNWATGDDAAATINGSHYNSWDPMLAELDVAYNWEGLKAYINFATKVPYSMGLVGGIEYYGDRYALKGEAQLANILAGTQGPDALWGYYKLLDIIHLEAAYRSRWNKWWTSDETAGIIDAYGNRPLKYGVNVFPGPWDGKNTWGLVDGHNFLLANVELSNFNFGIKVPILFEGDNYTFTNNGVVTDRTPFLLVDDVLKNSVVGLKFGLEVVEFAAQFYMKDYGVYFGGIAHAGPVDVGISFMGILGEKNTAGETVGMTAKFGGKVSYGADAFTAYASGFYGVITKNADSSATTQIGIEPGFYYNVIPTHLRFQTDVGFYFNGLKIASEAVDLEEDAVVWAVRPQLFWNFLGTGAGNFDGINTGMIIRYKLISGNRNNTLDAVFKWSF